MLNFLDFTMFDYPGAYLEQMKSLPDAVEALGKLVRQSVIHRSTLAMGNVGTNADMRFGDMRDVGQFRQADDDYLVTAAAMLAELYRLDARGLVADRDVSKKIVATCRFVAVLVSSIFKAKGIPVRIRAGFVGYFDIVQDGTVRDHWVNEYWDGEKWILIDVDGSFSMDASGLNPYALSPDKFVFGHTAWLNLRKKNDDPVKYQNAGGFYGLFPAAWALIHDFHAIMGRPITYLQTSQNVVFPLGGSWKEQMMDEAIAQTLDELAYAMQDIEKNEEKLLEFWQNPAFRLVHGGLL